MYDLATDPMHLNYLIYEENLFLFLSVKMPQDSVGENGVPVFLSF